MEAFVDPFEDWKIAVRARGAPSKEGDCMLCAEWAPKWVIGATFGWHKEGAVGL